MDDLAESNGILKRLNALSNLLLLKTEQLDNN